MDWQQFATQFGLPGVMLLAIIGIAKLWLASHEKLELERIKVEDKKADAMTAALTSLSGKLDSHHTIDLQSHRDLGEGIARIEGALGFRHEPTPVGGGTFPETGERRTPSAYGPQRPPRER
jgi:hypothetical protein